MRRLALLLAIALLPATLPTRAADGHAPAGTPSHAVRISGAVKAPAEFDVAALKKLLPRDTGPVDVVCASGALKGTVQNFRGVRLTDVLDHVGIDFKAHKDDRRMVIVEPTERMSYTSSTSVALNRITRETGGADT